MTQLKLTQIAFDILTIPATSNDCKWVFNKTGDLLKPYHLKLYSDIIAALQCNYSYLKMGFKRFSK